MQRSIAPLTWRIAQKMIFCVQEQQQKKAARLLVLEKLHRDLAAKFQASRADVSRLQVRRLHTFFFCSLLLASWRRPSIPGNWRRSLY